MSSPIYNAIRAESAGFGETNDCTVVAFCAASGMGYAEAHALHRAGGRRNRKGMSWSICLKVWERAGWRLGPGVVGHPRTVGSLLNDRRLRTGTWIVETRAHVLCLADGEVMDWTDGRRHRVISVRAFLPADSIEPPKPTLAAVAERYFTTGDK